MEYDDFRCWLSQESERASSDRRDSAAHFERDDKANVTAPRCTLTALSVTTMMASAFTGRISADASKAAEALPAAKDRYHLYVALTCPFAHRTLVLRKLKGLEEAVTCDVLHYNKDRQKSWHFQESKEDPECTSDRVSGKSHLSEIYKETKPDYDGKFSVPVLFDKQTKRIVSNDSGQIIEMLNSEFNEFCATPEQAKIDLFPEGRRKDIGDTIKWINDDINLGVYKACFADSQAKYDDAVVKVFAALDKVEDILSKNRYLLGKDLTLADVRLYTSLVRFDAAYYSLFKCNLRPLTSYPNTYNYLKELYQMDAFGSTTNFRHIKRGYYMGFRELNPSGIVPVGPEMDLESKHDRADKKF